MPMIDAAIHDAVMALPPDERRDRRRINEAVRDGLKLGPLRPAGSADCTAPRALIPALCSWGSSGYSWARQGPPVSVGPTSEIRHMTAPR